MINSKMPNWTRWTLLLCAAALIAVLFFPLWRIDLVAPQYPEGLVLLIYPNKLAGNVDIINGLNHYIGMKTLHTEDFWEFTALPYIVVFFAIFFLLVALSRRKKSLYFLFIFFVVFGIAAIYDFWRWEYNYGHNLNPDAAIIVPGMAYQPPLIGFKQLLNFAAYSFPDIGGWIFVGVGILLFICVIAQWKLARVSKKRYALSGMGFIVVFFFAACTTGPKPFKTGVDNCDFCKMTITDNRFGGELITKKGKVYKFDDLHCLLEFKKQVNDKNIKEIYLINFTGTHDFIRAKEAVLLSSENLKSPMGGNMAAFKNEEELVIAKKQFAGTSLKWTEALSR
ncbi:MAG TPA: nitrous oxide reductase accessory protein NosL [Chitinophagaceae bacterium]|nr:nitrous oxide reductase accessory protein NosL [Chitinophagaceae bacterium]